jgi:pimeloyl-ACP methyl ester carboxylesterase
MCDTSLLRSAGYCLSAALFLAISTSGVTFAAQPDVPPGLATKDPPGVPPGQAKKSILQIESQGARAFGGTRVPLPNNPANCIGSVCSEPTNFIYCDHGYTEWEIPSDAHQHALVFTHGSGIRGYMTTWDGQPGFQTIFLKQNYPVYLVDLPWTGRAGLACQNYTWDGPTHVGYSSKFVFSNRLGIPAIPGIENGTFFPGVAFSNDPKALDQYYRVQYFEVNGTAAEERETDALAVLMEEIYKQHGKGGVVFAHSSGASRPSLLALKTDKIGGFVLMEGCGQKFPVGEPPPPLVAANGTLVPYTGPFVSQQDFLKFTKFPILMLWGDNIPRQPDPANATGPGASLDGRRLGLERCGQWADAINNKGGNAINMRLPDVGVFGNTHYLFADTNVNKVADVVSLWLKNQGLDN